MRSALHLLSPPPPASFVMKRFAGTLRDASGSHWATIYPGGDVNDAQESYRGRVRLLLSVILLALAELVM